VDQEALLLSEDEEETAAWRLFVRVLSIREMVDRVDQAARGAGAVGVVKEDRERMVETEGQ
jgi:hypothetical protein